MAQPVTIQDHVIAAAVRRLQARADQSKRTADRHADLVLDRDGKPAVNVPPVGH